MESNQAGLDQKNFDGKASKRIFGYFGNGGWSIPSFPSLSQLPDITNNKNVKSLESEVEQLESENLLMKKEIVSSEFYGWG